MNRWLKTALLAWMIIQGSVNIVHAQADEIQQLILNYEKLAQLKKILKNMKEGYEIVTKGYNTVKGLSEGNFRLHDVFLSGLMQVSPAVRNYRRIPDNIDNQANMIREYKAAYERFKRSGSFTTGELHYMVLVYDNLVVLNLSNLEQLTIAITSGKARMSDDERLKEIDRIYLDTEDKLSFLRHFNSQAAILSVQRHRQSAETGALQNYYDIQKK